GEESRSGVGPGFADSALGTQAQTSSRNTRHAAATPRAERGGLLSRLLGCRNRGTDLVQDLIRHLPLEELEYPGEERLDLLRLEAELGELGDQRRGASAAGELLRQAGDRTKDAPGGPLAGFGGGLHAFAAGDGPTDLGEGFCRQVFLEEFQDGSQPLLGLLGTDPAFAGQFGSGVCHEKLLLRN